MNRLNRRQILAGAAATGAMTLAASDVPARIFTVSSSIEGTIAECIKAGGGIVHIPAGTHTIDQRIEIEKPPGLGLALRGDGPGLSKLIWRAASGGIEVRFQTEGGFAGSNGAIGIEGLTLLAENPDAGAAIRLTGGAGTSPSPKKLVRDVILAGWSVGVDCNECTFATLDGIDFQGSPRGNSVAVRFTGEHDPVDNYISRLRVFGARDGIEVAGNCEGIYVTQTTMLGVERGVHWHTTRGEPLLAMSGCHISASRDCILGHNLIQPILTGNLFYQSGASEEWAGVRLSADSPSIYDLMQVSHNTIHGFPNDVTKTRTGIFIAGRTGGIVQGNIIQGVSVGVRLDEKSGNVRVLDNFVQQFADVDVRDDGKGNVIRR